MSLEQSLRGSKRINPDALDRYEFLRKIARENNDDFLEGALEDLFNNALRYIEIVSTQASKIARVRNSDVSQRDYIDFITRLGNSRRRKHQAIISQINMIQRYLTKEYGMNSELSGIIPGRDKATFSDSVEGEDREFVREWCYELTRGYYDD